MDDFFGLALLPIVAGSPLVVAVEVDDGAEVVFSPFEMEEGEFAGLGDDLLPDHFATFVGELDNELWEEGRGM